MKRLIYILPLLFLLLSACDSSPVFDLTPEIEFVSISPDMISQDSVNGITIIIKFKDGDGDLGAINTSDSPPNLFVKDMRPEVADSNYIFEYTMPNLTPETRKPSIQGTIEVTMDSPQLTKNFIPPFDGPDQEEALFEVYILDRAGNQSNTILTSAILLTE